MTGLLHGIIQRLRAVLTTEAQRRLARMTETFMAEVGVLLLVFPILDKLIATGQISPRYVLYSLLGGVSFYTIAAFLAVYIGE